MLFYNWFSNHSKKGLKTDQNIKMWTKTDFIPKIRFWRKNRTIWELCNRDIYFHSIFFKHRNSLKFSFYIFDFFFLFFLWNNSNLFVIINKYQAHMHNIYFTWSSCCHNRKWNTNAQKFSFCNEIKMTAKLWEENGTLLVNEFSRHCLYTHTHTKKKKKKKKTLVIYKII